MQETLQNKTPTVKTGHSMDSLSANSTHFTIEINIEKTKTMNITANDSPHILMKETYKKEVDTSSYLGAIICKEGGSHKEKSRRIAKTCAPFNKKGCLSKSKSISTKCKMKLLKALVISVLLHGYESSQTNNIEKRIHTMENKCYRRLLCISYKDHSRQMIADCMGPHKDLV